MRTRAHLMPCLRNISARQFRPRSVGSICWRGMMVRTTRLAATLLASAALGLFTEQVTLAPAYAESTGVLHTHYDGVTNDLLTAALGRTGLRNAAAQAIA